MDRLKNTVAHLFRDGCFDLKDASFTTQAYALSRARAFFEASPSGAAAIALAFGAPTARCNADDLRAVLPSMGFLVPQRVKNVARVDVTEETIKARLFQGASMRGIEILR